MSDCAVYCTVLQLQEVQNTAVLHLDGILDFAALLACQSGVHGKFAIALWSEISRADAAVATGSVQHGKYSQLPGKSTARLLK